MRNIRLLALLLVCALVPSLAHAAADLSNVGAPTPFNPANALDLASYCNGFDTVADDACIETWLRAAQTTGKHLYVSPGTYLMTYGHVPTPPYHIRCANPLTTIFKGLDGLNQFFLLLGEWGDSAHRGPEPWSDISVENCGFDMNATPWNFSGVISLVGYFQPITGVTVRGNRVFDSTMPGTMCYARDCQRQYITVMYANDVLIEHNTLSEGGRIKFGGPAHRVVVRNNSLNNINDNGITMADYAGNYSSDVLIEYNRVHNPIGSGIFAGADGQEQGTAAMILEDLTIRNNTVTGFFGTSCLHAMMPNHAARIAIVDNLCVKTDALLAGQFVAGVSLARNDTSVLDVTDITVSNNVITSDVTSAYGALGPIYVAFNIVNVCILDNTITNQFMAIHFTSYTTGKMTGNNFGGGVIREDFTPNGMDTSGSRAGCHLAPQKTDGLVGWWGFNETSGTTTADLAGFSNTASLTGGAVFSGTPQFAVSLDGVSAYVNAGDVANSETSSALTIAYWVNPSVLATSQGHLGKIEPTGSTTNNSWAIRTQNSLPGEIYVFVYGATDGGVNFFATDSLALPATTWTHIAIVLNCRGCIEADRLKVYKNGARVSGGVTGTIPATLNPSTAPVTLGRILVPGTFGQGNFQGLMDDVRIYNRALSQNELQPLVNSRQ